VGSSFVRLVTLNTPVKTKLKIDILFKSNSNLKKIFYFFHDDVKSRGKESGGGGWTTDMH